MAEAKLRFEHLPAFPQETREHVLRVVRRSNPPDAADQEVITRYIQLVKSDLEAAEYLQSSLAKQEAFLKKSDTAALRAELFSTYGHKADDLLRLTKEKFECVLELLQELLKDDPFVQSELSDWVGRHLDTLVVQVETMRRAHASILGATAHAIAHGNGANIPPDHDAFQRSVESMVKRLHESADEEGRMMRLFRDISAERTKRIMTQQEQVDTLFGRVMPHA